MGSTVPDHVKCSSTLPDNVECYSTEPDNVECPSPVPEYTLPRAWSSQVKVLPAGRRCGCSFPCLTSWLLLLLLLAVSCVLATLLETLHAANKQTQVMA